MFGQEDSLQQVLKQLMELQRLDTQLKELESLRGDLPHQVSRLNQELEETEKFLEDREEKLRVYQREGGIVGMEIKALEGKQKRYQAQLFEVKTNRAYDAVTHEIEAVKTDAGKKESRLLELMDLEEETKKALEEAKEEIENLKRQLDGRSKELRKRLEKTEKDEAALMDKRGKILRKLEPRLLAAYERIRKAKNGLAVVPVVRNACGGCFKTLPPQRILEIRQMNHRYLCEVCGRILVWDEDASGGAE